MRGSVANHHILLNVVFVLPGRPDATIEMVVDTGYVGTLTLPSTVVQSFNLPFIRRTQAKLADGTSIYIGVHLATFVWHNRDRTAEVIALDDRPLLGMLLLDGSQMEVDFSNGGHMQLNEAP